MTDGLKDNHRNAIIDILSANKRVERAVLFGSRAMETFTPASDIDIALCGDLLTLTDQANLATAIDELPMAQRVDLLLHATVNNEALCKHIEEHGIEWYRRGTAKRLDLPRRYRDQIEALLREHVPGVEVWAYGSRVTGKSHKGSDLDLVLRGPDLKRIPGGQLMDLIEALEESNVPIIVQAHDWARLPENFHREIEREYVVLVETADRTTLKSAVTAGEWRTVALAEAPVEIIDGDRGKNYPKQYEFLETGHCLFLNAGNVTIDGFNFSSCAFISSDKDKQLRKGKLARHDVVLTTRGTIGNAAYFDESVPYEHIRINSGMVILRTLKSALHPRYLYLLIRSKLFLSQVQALRTGSAQPQLPIRDIEKINISIPPLSKQHAIAHILGTLDDKIELNRRMNETLEEMARALFKSWFVDFDPVRAKMEGRDTGLPPDVAALFPDRLVESELGEIPEGWEAVPLPKIIEVNPPRSLRKGEVAPYLDMANMPTRGHVPDTVIDRPFGSGMRFTNGDTLVARITPCLENGKTAYVDFLGHDHIGWGSTEYIVMRPMPPLPNEFAYCLARSTGFREFAIQNMTGTSGRQRVPASALSQFLLPSPPEPIAARFGKVVQPLFTRASEAVRESRTLAALRDTLLPELVSGELRVAGVNQTVTRRV